MTNAADFAHEKGLFLHIDGARIFNAAATSGVPAKDLVQSADSVTFCLSKGLCAPVGSVLVGSQAFILRAKRIRKMLGGGMRQVGVLAAAGIIAVNKMTNRLTEDHRRAAILAEGLAKIPGITFEMGMPQTNMVFAFLSPEVAKNTADVSRGLSERGLKVGVVGHRSFRLVTHYWIGDEDIETAIQIFSDTLK
jgi:threonine aldolase